MIDIAKTSNLKALCEKNHHRWCSLISFSDSFTKMVKCIEVLALEALSDWFWLCFDFISLNKTTGGSNKNLACILIVVIVWCLNTFVLPYRYCSVSISRWSKITRAAFSGVNGCLSLVAHRIEYLWFVDFGYNHKVMENKIWIKLELMSYNLNEFREILMSYQLWDWIVMMFLCLV